jgi:hypothetical protein
MACMVSISCVQVPSRRRIAWRSWPAMSAKSWPAENTLPLPARTTPVASLSPTSAKADVNSCMCSRDKALRRSGRFIQMVTSPSWRVTSMHRYSLVEAAVVPVMVTTSSRRCYRPGPPRFIGGPDRPGAGRPGVRGPGGSVAGQVGRAGHEH